MVRLAALAVMLMSADPGAEPSWQKASEQDGVTVFARQKAGTDLTELMGQGTIDASPQAVMAMVFDYDAYPKTMPYIEACKVLSRESEGKVLYVYNRVAAPLVAKRDYVLKVSDASDWQDGRGYLKMAWTSAGGRGPSPAPGVVRVTTSDGYWKLEPRDGGKRTFATYYLFADPGGSIPRFIVDQANTSAVPDIFRAVRRATAKK